MDTQTAWAIMDRMRETQIAHGATLAGLSQKLDALASSQQQATAILQAMQTAPSRSGSTLTPRLMAFFAGVSIKSAAQWAVVALTVPYLAKGGDILSLMKILIGLL